MNKRAYVYTSLIHNIEDTVIGFVKVLIHFQKYISRYVTNILIFYTQYEFDAVINKRYVRHIFVEFSI